MSAYVRQPICRLLPRRHRGGRRRLRVPLSLPFRRARAEKRQKALVAPSADRRERIAAVEPKEQVAQSLKELEAKQKAKDKSRSRRGSRRPASPGRRKRYYIFSVAIGVSLGVILLAYEKPAPALGAAVRGRFRLAALGAELPQEAPHQQVHSRAAERRRRHRARHSLGPAARRLPAHRGKRRPGAVEVGVPPHHGGADRRHDGQRGHRQALRAGSDRRSQLLRAS